MKSKLHKYNTINIYLCFKKQLNLIIIQLGNYVMLSFNMSFFLFDKFVIKKLGKCTITRFWESSCTFVF